MGEQRNVVVLVSASPREGVGGGGTVRQRGRPEASLVVLFDLEIEVPVALWFLLCFGCVRELHQRFEFTNEATAESDNHVLVCGDLAGERRVWVDCVCHFVEAELLET